MFLDTLEPYVLMGKLKTLSPEVIAAFVDRCQVRCEKQRSLYRNEGNSFEQRGGWKHCRYNAFPCRTRGRCLFGGGRY